MICDHAASEWCACLPRPAPHIGSLVQKRGPGERVPAWRCQCRDPWTNRPLRSYQRHKDAIACIPAEDVEAFAEAHGLKDMGNARALLYINSFRPSLTTGKGA